ncbi:hypothetical protein B296_00019856 [Ensete ventricosum]|uniref:Uncharacterized protein n=1 Tax=Ensete ventricosum TaxID=4639 RepID=A0A427A3U0_ENSVE|nr:hypothetical protein B296_00019856 [Ensete ventricosum]
MDGTLDVASYRTIQGCFHPVTTRNWSVMVDLDCHHPLPRGISLAEQEGEEARKKKEKEGEQRETSVVGEPRDSVADEENLMRQ